MVTWLRQYKFALALFALGLAVGCGGAWVGFSFYAKSPQHFGVEVGKAILALGTGLILGGALKAMLDMYQATQEQRAGDHELRERLLSDLRNVHDQAETARLMIAAHRSAKAYGEQMRHLIGCQVVLLKIKRSLDLRPSLQDVGKKAVCLADMVGYLRALQHEYTRNYSLVADCQRYDTAVRRRRLEELATTDAPFDPSTGSSHDAWDLLNDSAMFPVLEDFTKCGDKYSARFREPLNQVAALLLGVENPHPDAAQFDGRVEGVAADVASIGTTVLQQAVSKPNGDPPTDVSS
jgi:hypothetical protein